MGSLSTNEPDFDVLIIGAGLSGISSIYHLRKLFPSWHIRALETADEVGGTWNFNRYPGARFDSESVSYHLSWDKEYLQQWDWKEEFAAQEDILKYINGFCDKNDIYRDVQFNTRIDTARWQSETRTWALTDSHGHVRTARFVITGVGILSAPQLPKIPGIENFKGQAFHTSRWPRDFDYKTGLVGKRVGVIGTAATGIQTITAISQVDVKSLTVFQRTASWCAPLRNKPIEAGTMSTYKTQYDAIFEKCANAPTGFLYGPDPRLLFDVPKQEREAFWEKLYSEQGFGKWLSVFKDTYTDPAANKEYSNWMAAKMRARVHDPVVAEKLIPKDHGFGTKRVPLESGYFEAFNKPNVHLVDLRETPITTVTENGITTSDGEGHELDVLVYATGFDAITGALSAIKWYGEDGRPLFGPSRQEHDGKPTSPVPIWPDHNTKTFLGLMAPSLPNVFMILGPHQPYGNVPRSIENSTNVIMDLLQHVYSNGYTYVDPTPKAADEWYQHVVQTGEGLLASSVSSWATGVNTNVDGRRGLKIAKYSGTYQQWLNECHKSKDAGWKGLNFA